MQKQIQSNLHRTGLTTKTTAKLSILKPKEYDLLCLTTPDADATQINLILEYMPATQINLILEYLSSTELKQQPIFIIEKDKFK